MLREIGTRVFFPLEVRYVDPSSAPDFDVFFLFFANVSSSSLQNPGRQHFAHDLHVSLNLKGFFPFDALTSGIFSLLVYLTSEKKNIYTHRISLLTVLNGSIGICSVACNRHACDGERNRSRALQQEHISVQASFPETSVVSCDGADTCHVSSRGVIWFLSCSV